MRTPVRTFPVRVIISAYYGRLACDFTEVREFYNYIAGTEIPLWEITRFRRTLVPHLQRRVRHIELMGPPHEYKGDSPSVSKWSKAAVRIAGADELAVTPMPPGWFTPRSGVEALR